MERQVESKPAWQTDELADEWPDSEESKRTGTVRSTKSDQEEVEKHGSLKILEDPAGQGNSEPVGTFIVREDLPAARMPQTPGKGKQGVMKDIFSPLALEKMFDPPSPPEQTSAQPTKPSPPLGGYQHNSSRPVRPSKLSQVIAASTFEEENEEQNTSIDEIVETDMPNVGMLGGRKLAPDCLFTFAVPRQSSLSPDPDVAQPSPYLTPQPQAQSTPNPPSQMPPQAHPSTDPRLRLFQFQYDTYTRDHLSALVDSFGVNSPSTSSGNRSSPVTGLQPVEEEQTEKGDDGVENESFSRLRSSKRIKLTPPSEAGDGTRKFVNMEQDHTSLRKDYVGESRSLMEQIKRARDISMMSVVSNVQLNTAQDFVKEALAASTQDAHLLQVPNDPYMRPPSSASTASTSMSSNSNAGGRSSKYSSLGYRRQAADLMAKIKGDMVSSRRLFSEKTDKSFISQKGEGGIVDERSSAPSPETRPWTAFTAHSNWQNTIEEREDDPEPPSYIASIRSHPRIEPRRTARSSVAFNRASAVQDGDIVLPVVVTSESSQMHASVTSDMHSTDRIRSPNPTFLAPPADRHGVHFETGPNVNEDLNRFISSSTTATSATTGTTLTAGSAASFVKHPGPAQLVRIAPTDLPEMPDRVGRMVFDRNLMRWVKERPVQASAQNAEADSREGDGESEDPFRDIESLRDDDSGRPAEIQEESGFQTDIPIETIEDMQLVDSSSDSELDDEDMELSTFSFSGPPGVVQVMTGETETVGYFDEESTDSELDERIAEIEYTIDEAKLSSDLASLKVADEVHARAIEERLATTVGEASIVRTARVTTVSTPVPLQKQQTYQPRSALKNTTITPINKSGHRRSVSFSDGRKDGKIRGLDDNGEIIPDTIGGTLSYHPSVRSKRIADMLDDLEGPSYDDSPSKGNQNVARPSTHVPEDRDGQVVDREESNIIDGPAKKSFSRSHTIRAEALAGPKGMKNHTHSHANATFLTECSFGVAHDQILRVITDIQPFEPYWEALSSIDLSGRKLDSVARLKEFLPRLDSLILNNNLLSWLSGVPTSVRTLAVSSNALTSLTSFGHLLNLESLDISYNDIDSLKQLSCLRHLRELRAEGNKITSLEGLERLDGLLKLDLQSNELKSIELSTFKWSRLEVLDLSRNRLEYVLGIAALSSLQSLNLDNNALASLDFSFNIDHNDYPPSYKLRILRLSGNSLKYLDVSYLKNLRTLYLDNNCLADSHDRTSKHSNKRLLNLHLLSKLENFSARNQRGHGYSSGIHLESEDIRDVKRLYLSGNPSPFPLNPTAQACYHLVYLELAACRLTTLPSNFSALVPNLRALNLNYNFLETDDIAHSLSGLRRLRKLTIVGNRMNRTNALITLLTTIGTGVEMLDFRMNPCTLGWYLPLLVQEDKDTPHALLQPSESASTQRHESGRAAFPSSMPSALPSNVVIENNNTKATERGRVSSEARGRNRFEPRPQTDQQRHDLSSKEEKKRGIGTSVPSSYPSSSGAGSASMPRLRTQIDVRHGAKGMTGKDRGEEVQHGPGSENPSESANGYTSPPLGQQSQSQLQSQAQSLRKRRRSDPPTRWEALDSHFRRGLPDAAYAGRLAYRGLIMRACPNLRTLDGVWVEEKERRKAEALLMSVFRNKGSQAAADVDVDTDLDKTIRGV